MQKLLNNFKVLENRIYQKLVFQLGYNLWISISLTFLLGYVDASTGYELSFQFFYFIPLFLTSYNNKISKFGLIIFVLFVTSIWFIADYFAGHTYSHKILYVWNTFSRLIVFVSFSVFLNSILKQRMRINNINSELSKKNDLIQESIAYAKTIQEAILPSFSVFSKIFPDSFIFYKPKDVLSGDFFWFHEDENSVYFAVIDCTGHGIPGALLSFVGNELLNKVIIDSKLSEPISILNQIKKELNHVTSLNEKTLDDGMEISLVKFERKNKTIEVVQTTQSLLFVNENGIIRKFKSSLAKVGGPTSKISSATFISEKQTVTSNSILYLYSDGFVDQFGDFSNGNIRKYGSKRFLDFIQSNYMKATNVQCEFFSQEFSEWKGTENQVDDVTLIGIRFT